MLSTLFKYEFKNTYKVILTLYGILFAFTLLGVLFISNFHVLDYESSLATLGLGLYVLMYIFTIFACLIISLVYLTVYFYKTMYSSQGYLTLTLPVNPVTIFNVKLVVSTIWIFCSLILVFLSLFSILLAVAGQADVSFNAYSFKQEKALFLSGMGMRSGEFILFTVIGFLLSCLLSPLRLYVSCSLGQLFNHRKVTASIIIGIIIIFAHTSISSTLTNLLDIYETNSNLLFGDTAWILLCIDTFFVILFYIGNVIIVKKHINLE